MSYCADRESAIVTYRFKDKPEKTARFDNTPIEVTVNQILQTGLDGADLNTYYWIYGTIVVSDGQTERTILWKSSGRVIGPLNSWVAGYLAGFRTGIIFNNDGGKRILLDQVDAQGNYTGYSRIGGDPESVRITHVEGEMADPVCELKVTYDNRLIFRAAGKCPGTFEVSCDGCPPNHIKCPIKKHPGYCCIPCASVAAELAAMKLKVRRINHG